MSDESNPFAAVAGGAAAVTVAPMLPAAALKHPLFTVYARAAARRKIRLDHGRGAAEEADAAFQPSYVDAAVQQVGVKGGVSAIGDGSILQAILAWLGSPQGQAVISALVSILLHAIGL